MHLPICAYKNIMMVSFAAFLSYCADSAYAGVSAVKAVHDYVRTTWSINIPYTAGAKNVINMKYLMALVDASNEEINGRRTTDYAHDSKYATNAIVSSEVAVQAIKELIKEVTDPEFSFTPETSSKSYGFFISAQGDYTIEWGDGQSTTVNKTNTTKTEYTHSYSNAANTYTIKLSGKATKYNTDTKIAAISFSNGQKDGVSDNRITSMDGCLGCIFSTLSDGSQPSFYQTFQYNTELRGSIPPNLFGMVSGAPVSYMFYGTFHKDGNLTGEIPPRLFINIKGKPAEAMFSDTFNGCTGLTGTIHASLFKGISGAPAVSMFENTFRGCGGFTELEAGIFSGIVGKPAAKMFSFTFRSASFESIPAGLFSGISGAPADNMFTSTFSGCASLTTIGENLFGNISATPAATDMFKEIFLDCTSLIGHSATVGTSSSKEYLYKRWPDGGQNGYANCTGLMDWYQVPVYWGGTADPNEYSFFLVPETSGKTFNFKLGAAGRFIINWGEGDYEIKDKTTTTTEIVSHTYTDGKAANKHTVRLGGAATKYSSDPTVSAISFYDSQTDDTYFITSMDGCLGCIFPTQSDGTQPSFYRTFYYNVNLKGEVPDGLFVGLKGQPIEQMFESLFHKDERITGAIPKKFFADLSGSPTRRLFANTFNGMNLLESIPDDLFSGISGAPAEEMFYRVFRGDWELKEIPSGLFDGISGKPAIGMFEHAFYNTGISEVPSGLFKNISGSPVERMFSATFRECTYLQKIGSDLFGDISGTAADDMFSGLFYDCPDVTGYSATVGTGSSKQYLYERWPSFDSTVGEETAGYYNDTKLTDYASIPEFWGGPTYEFYFKPATSSDSYSFSISAAGTFFIDWGDGKFDAIRKNNTNTETISHTYSGAASDYEISLGGKATAYNVNSAISFFDSNAKIKSMRGCLGCIFSTITDTSVAANVRQPRFSSTFSGNTELTSIPSGLFNGITGAPVDAMFDETFYDCRNVTEIPTGLFAGLSGAPQPNLFVGTFEFTAITSIPSTLFSGIKGALAVSCFSGTFAYCEKLQSIPTDLFSGISTTGGYASMAFNSTFANCSSVTGPSPQIGGKYLYEIWPDAYYPGTFSNDRGLDDYQDMPSNWI